MKKIGALLSVMVILIAGCATPAYKEVFKQEINYNSQDFSVPKDTLYDAAIRAVCSKGFILEKEDRENGFILAKRSLQRGKRTVILVLQGKIMANQQDQATLYLNALQTTERFFVADHTRFFLFVIPLPGGGGKEGSTIKEGESVIQDKTFYQNFFLAIEKEIENLARI